MNTKKKHKTKALKESKLKEYLKIYEQVISNLGLDKDKDNNMKKT